MSHRHLHCVSALKSFRWKQQQQQDTSPISAVMAPLFFLFLLSEAASESNGVPVITEELGKNVTLKCQTGDVTITAVEWTRSDLVYPDYVLFSRYRRSVPDHQHSSFKGRVQLVDGELKNGDVSLILKNVKREDNGTYECRVLTAGSGRKRRAIIKTDPISIIELQVTENQKEYIKDGHNGDTNNGNFTRHHVGLAAAVFLVCLVSAAAAAAAVGPFLFRKSKIQREKKSEPSPDEETGDNLI